MLIDDVAPDLVGGHSTLQARLRARAAELGLPSTETDTLISSVPLRLLGADCFFDKLCDCWRYEFGSPYELPSGRRHVSTDIWPPVDVLIDVLRAALRVMDSRTRRGYFTRLSDVERYQDALAEFMPVVRLPEAARPVYEAPTGRGNRNADWLIPTDQQPLLLEVKRRFREALESAEQIARGERAPDGTAPDPKHDPAYLFRSVQSKFDSVDPDVQLQGVWIAGTFRQVEDELNAAFTDLDAARVHYAILGDWEPGFTVLYRREVDLRLVESVFREPSTRRFLCRRRGDA